VSRAARYGWMLAGAAGLAALFRSCHLPAAWLFGPLVVSAWFAVKEWGPGLLPTPLYLSAQAVIGTALGAGFLPQTLQALPRHWGIFSFAVAFILFASLANGWLLVRYARVHPATAFLGTMPGGASVMAAMSDSLHADTALVTAMQYLRLLLILASLALLAPVLHHFSNPTPMAGAGALLPHAVPATGKAIGILIVLAACGWMAARWTPIPAAAFLIPLMLYFFLGLHGIVPGVWPWPVLAIAYGVMGLQIGARFHPSTLRTIGRVFLPVMGTTLLLLLASVALAWIVAREMGLGWVSAYLAATPGGLDSVAAVAAELKVDTTIVVAMQLVRILCVLAVGPWLVRACVRLVR